MRCKVYHFTSGRQSLPRRGIQIHTSFLIGTAIRWDRHRQSVRRSPLQVYHIHSLAARRDRENGGSPFHQPSRTLQLQNSLSGNGEFSLSEFWPEEAKDKRRARNRRGLCKCRQEFRAPLTTKQLEREFLGTRMPTAAGMEL